MNMKYVGLLLIGLVLGFGIGRYTAPVPPPPVVESQPEPATPPPEDAVDQSSLEPAAPPDTPVTSVDKALPSNNLPPPASGPSLNVNEDLVVQMEQQWDDLPNQIHMTREEKGWRVSFIQSGSPLAQAGVQAGDLITPEMVDAVSDGASGGGVDEDTVSDRLVNIFNYVSSN